MFDSGKWAVQHVTRCVCPVNHSAVSVVHSRQSARWGSLTYGLLRNVDPLLIVDVLLCCWWLPTTAWPSAFILSPYYGECSTRHLASVTSSELYPGWSHDWTLLCCPFNSIQLNLKNYVTPVWKLEWLLNLLFEYHLPSLETESIMILSHIGVQDVTVYARASGS